MSIVDKLKRLLGLGATNGAPEAVVIDSASEMIPCEHALRLVHDFLDGELEGVSEEKVRAHFDVCGRCYPHLRLESTYREAVQRAGRGERAPEELKSKVAQLLAEARSEG